MGQDLLCILVIIQLIVNAVLWRRLHSRKGQVPLATAQRVVHSEPVVPSQREKPADSTPSVPGEPKSPQKSVKVDSSQRKRAEEILARMDRTGVFEGEQRIRVAAKKLARELQISQSEAEGIVSG